MIAAIRENFFQREIAEASFRYQSEVEAEERIVVGVNGYEIPAEDDVPIPILRIDPALEREQIGRVQALRARRDTAAVEAALARLKADAGRRGPQPDGPDRRRQQGVRDDGRDVRRLPRGLGRLAGDTGLLTPNFTATPDRLSGRPVQSSIVNLKSPRNQRYLLLVSGIVLAAGIAAFLIVFLRNTGSTEQERFTNKPVQKVSTPKKAPLEPAVRVVAGKFILTAVQRKNLGQAWSLAGPGIRQGLSRKEWLSGNIPVVPFLKPIKLTSLKVDLSSKNYALIELSARAGEGQGRDLRHGADQGRQGRQGPLGRRLVGAARGADDPEQPERLDTSARACTLPGGRILRT